MKETEARNVRQYCCNYKKFALRNLPYADAGIPIVLRTLTLLLGRYFVVADSQ